MTQFQAKSQRAPCRVEATEITAAIAANSPGARLGDWLVTTEDGHTVTTTAAQFKNDFEEVK